MNEMFSPQGQVNAGSVSEALQVIAKYAAAMEHQNQPANVSLHTQSGYSNEARDELISRAILTQEGKVALAQAMSNPIRRNLDYQGIARRALVVDPLN